MKQSLPQVLLTGMVVLFLSVQVQAQRPVINHLALNVSNLKRSTIFYQEIIGLDTMADPFRDGKHTWLRMGPVSHLHLIEAGLKSRADDKNTHLCFTVPSVQEFVLKLDKAGLDYEDWPGNKKKITIRIDGVRQVYLKDPDGFWIEVNDARY